MKHFGHHEVTVGRCPNCPRIHLIVRENGRVVASVPMERDEWAQLIGAYGDLFGGANYLSNERRT